VSTLPLTAYLEGIGVLGPGLANWPATAVVLNGQAPWHPERTIVPMPQWLPAAERRRTNTVVKLALAVGREAVDAAAADAAHLLTVFTSSGADGRNCHEICEALASEERELSPTRFHNSVHNAPAGYWGIATGAMQASNVVCAYDASFAAGLLDALMQVVVEQKKVLLISYDAQYPPPLHDKRPLPDAFGVALLLSPTRGAGALAQLSAQLSDDPQTRLAESPLESMRAAIPAARVLPLLQILARGQRGIAVIEYLAPSQLRVEVNPCD
jgi:hypothetical protein